MELEVLKGMKESLKNVEYILIEISDEKYYESIFEMLKKNDFTYVYDISINTTNIGTLEESSYLKNNKYRYYIDDFSKIINNKQKNLLFCKSSNLVNPSINIENILNENFINNINENKLEYAGMLNWSSDVPTGSKRVFENMLEKFKDKKCKILEIGTFVGTSVISMLKYLSDE